VISRKYLKDYRLEEQVDSSGRVKVKTVYIGGDYTISPDLPAGEKRRMIVLCILSGFLFVGALIPVSGAARLIYVLLPFVFSAFPVFLTSRMAISFYRSGGIMTRKQAEQIANYFPAYAAATMILTSAAFLGYAITTILSGNAMFLPGDVIFSAASFLMAVSAAVLLHKSHNMKAVPSPSPPGS